MIVVCDSSLGHIRVCVFSFMSPVFCFSSLVSQLNHCDPIEGNWFGNLVFRSLSWNFLLSYKSFSLEMDSNKSYSFVMHSISLHFKSISYSSNIFSDIFSIKMPWTVHVLLVYNSYPLFNALPTYIALSFFSNHLFISQLLITILNSCDSLSLQNDIKMLYNLGCWWCSIHN